MSKSRKKRSPGLPDLEQAKSAVLNTFTSVSGQRTYDRAIKVFIELGAFPMNADAGGIDGANGRRSDFRTDSIAWN